MRRETYISKIIDKGTVSTDVICLTLTKPKKFVYTAGQFTQFYIPDDTSEKKEVVRPYSIASIPSNKDLKFYIKLIPNGKAGEYLKKIKIGENIKIGKALGRFTNTDSVNPLYFIATGVGISSIIDIIQNELINKKTAQPMHLLFGVRSENDIFLTETLDKLKEKYKNFDYKITLSQPSEKWNGAKGRVTNHLPKKIEKNAHYFICGNMPMITDVSNFLKTQGADKTNIHFEAL